MSTQLIAHLKKKCEEDGNVAILFAQWEFDQKLVGKALENIGGFYPHFSNHNASHSQQILVNIERILGNDIELLSATDTWLILEAAYWHDVGMLVDAKNAKEVHFNPDFNFMIQTIANEKGHDLQNFCQAYVEKNWLSAIGTVDHPFDGIEQYRQLVAEWFRRGHDKRVGKIVEDPFKDLGITSPRTELLPNRIYRYLGQICVSHGMNFEALMETLPYKQTGLGTEDCHPRFIGCLLRLGDLFDLDDNRFCPVMAKHVSHMPSVSKHHHDKHLSLREFQLDKRTVKLVAECPDEMSYVETQNWFGWIREEFQNQMSQWNLIVPNLKFGSLPTIEQLEVRMKIEYAKDIRREKILLKNKPMKFTIDEKNGIEILQGSNLYANDNSIYRELIQNAIDSTMIRLWLEHKDELKDLHPYHEKYLDIIKNYQITINLEKLKDIESTLNSIWKFTIKDKGIGISRNDLVHMQNMAGSYKNLDKIKLISEMPVWMRPSGKFGIGLQSAFLLLDDDLDEHDKKIQFRTCSYINNELLEIEMFSPLGGKQGYCFITKVDGDVHREYGTELSIKIKKNFTFYGWSRFNSGGRENFWDRDIFDTKWNEFTLENIRNNIIINSPISSEKDIAHICWDSKNYMAIKFELKFFGKFLGFRGQNTKIDMHDNKIDKLLCGVHIDFYNLDPSEVLNISRDRWKEKFLKRINNEIFEYMEKYISENNSDETSMLSKLYSHKFKNFKCEDDRYLKFKFELNCNEGGKKGISINDLEKNDEFYIFDFQRLSMFHPELDLNDICDTKKYFFTENSQILDIFIELKSKFPNEVFSSHKVYFMNKQNYANDAVLFFSKNGSSGFNKIFDEEVEWLEIKDEIKNNSEDSIKNIFAFIKELIDSSGNGMQKNLKMYLSFINFSYIKEPELLNEYEVLVINDPNDKKFIVNPYQIVQNKIQLTNLNDLSMLVSQSNNNKITYEKVLSSYESLKEKIEKECGEYLD